MNYPTFFESKNSINLFGLKIVIAPKNWFSKESRKSESEKIIPKDWTQI